MKVSSWVKELLALHEQENYLEHLLSLPWHDQADVYNLINKVLIFHLKHTSREKSKYIPYIIKDKTDYNLTLLINESNIITLWIQCFALILLSLAIISIGNSALIGTIFY